MLTTDAGGIAQSVLRIASGQTRGLLVITVDALCAHRGDRLRGERMKIIARVFTTDGQPVSGRRRGA